MLNIKKNFLQLAWICPWKNFSCIYKYEQPSRHCYATIFTLLIQAFCFLIFPTKPPSWSYCISMVTSLLPFCNQICNYKIIDRE